MTAVSASAAGAVPLPEATTPVRDQGRPTPWWGMVCLIMTEGTLFAGLIGSYFFSWSFVVFPLWVGVLSMFILMDNMRRAS